MKAALALRFFASRWSGCLGHPLARGNAGLEGSAYFPHMLAPLQCQHFNCQRQCQRASLDLNTRKKSQYIAALGRGPVPLGKDG